jgi:hypothetical protein
MRTYAVSSLALFKQCHFLAHNGKGFIPKKSCISFDFTAKCLETAK